MPSHTDILVSGGGVAGLTAAAAFGSAGFQVLCVDPAPPVTDETAISADMRTTAILRPSLQVLQAAGLWERLAPHASSLQIMRIIDAGGREPKARLVTDFDAADISEEPFGHNIPNWLLRRELVARLSELPNVTFRPGIATTGLLTRMGEARVTLSDGELITARMLIAADGRDSPMRQALGIPVHTWRYGQKALAFAVTHSLPHQNVSTEIHRFGGPFTLVPLPDRDGRHASAVIWMETGPRVVELAALSDSEFEAAINLRSCGILGHLELATRRSVWPIISQVAARMNGERTALMAEAAHVVPPIGAQGLNMSLADLSALLGLARGAPDRLGDAAMLDAYHEARHRNIMLRVRGIDLLNRASMAHSRAMRDVRAGILKTLHACAPARRILMQTGLDPR